MDSTNTQLSAKKRGLKKAEFLKKEASPAVKKTAFISMVIFAVIAVLVIAATITTNTISMVDLPVMSLAMDASDRKQLKNEMKAAADLLDEADDVLDEIKEEYGSKTFKAAQNLVKKTKNVAKKMSVNNVIAMVASYEKLVKTADDDVVDQLQVESAVREMKEVASILKTVRTVTYIVAAVVILLALWAAAGKITGLSVLCVILYVPVCALLSSVLIAVLVAVALIALAVTTSRVNKAWKTA